MVISFFKASRSVSAVAIPFIALVFWSFSLYRPQVAVIENAAPFYALVQNLFASLPLLGIILGMLGVIAGGLLLNYLVTEFEILNTTTYMPALMYVVLVSLLPGMTVLHPLIFSNVFILLVLLKLIGSYRKDTAFGEFFDAGFLLGLATLFYVPSLVFMPLVWIALLTVRPFIWREWLSGLVGFILPFIFTVAFFFLADKLHTLDASAFIPKPVIPAADVNTDIYSLSALIILGFLVLLSFFKLNAGSFYITLRARKNTGILVWCLVFGLATVFFNPSFTGTHFIICAIPLAVFTSNYLLSFRRNTWPELLFYSLSIASLVAHAMLIFS